MRAAPPRASWKRARIGRRQALGRPWYLAASHANCAAVLPHPAPHPGPGVMKTATRSTLVFFRILFRHVAHCQFGGADPRDQPAPLSPWERARRERERERETSLSRIRSSELAMSNVAQQNPEEDNLRVRFSSPRLGEGRNAARPPRNPMTRRRVRAGVRAWRRLIRAQIRGGSRSRAPPPALSLGEGASNRASTASVRGSFRVIPDGGWVEPFLNRSRTPIKPGTPAILDDPRLRAGIVLGELIELQRGGAGHCQLVAVQHKLVLAVEHVLEGDRLPGVRGHAAVARLASGTAGTRPRCRACPCGWHGSGRPRSGTGWLGLWELPDDVAAVNFWPL